MLMSKRKEIATRRQPSARSAAGETGVNAPLPPPTADSVADAARQRMIAEAAYYIAERRGFAPGNELDDWLAAEAEITSSILHQEAEASELH
jgi:hypothetical protein